MKASPLALGHLLSLPGLHQGQAVARHRARAIPSWLFVQQGLQGSTGISLLLSEWSDDLLTPAGKGESRRLVMYRVDYSSFQAFSMRGDPSDKKCLNGGETFFPLLHAT